mgnify:CR=1 FL=1
MGKVEFINAYKHSFVTNEELKVQFEMGRKYARKSRAI